MNNKFEAGDLVHVPQDVLLWSTTGSAKTDKPTTAVVLDELSDTLVIFVYGRKMNAHKRHIYPYTQEKE
jgi:hypothetical protein